MRLRGDCRSAHFRIPPCRPGLSRDGSRIFWCPGVVRDQRRRICAEFADRSGQQRRAEPHPAQPAAVRRGPARCAAARFGAG